MLGFIVFWIGSPLYVLFILACWRIGGWILTKGRCCHNCGVRWRSWE